MAEKADAIARAQTPGSTAREYRGTMVAYEIPVERITADPNSPRTEFDPESLERLAKSLKSHGQIQPITVRHAEEPFHYVIVTGERRWRAAIMAGIPMVEAVVVRGPKSGAKRLELQVVENALREDLTPLDQARAFLDLMERNAWNGRELADALNVHSSTVSRALTLLDLPEPVRDEVEAGRIAPSVALEIARLTDPDQQIALAERVVSEGLSRSQTIDAVRALSDAPSRRSAPEPRFRRVIDTPAGRVTIEPKHGVDRDAVLAAFIAASLIIQEEIRADTIAMPEVPEIEVTRPESPSVSAGEGRGEALESSRPDDREGGDAPSGDRSGLGGGLGLGRGAGVGAPAGVEDEDGDVGLDEKVAEGRAVDGLGVLEGVGVLEE